MPLKFLSWIFASLLLVLSASPAGADSTEAVRLHLNSPKDYEVRQRTTRTAGMILVAGSVSGPLSVPASVESRLVGAGENESWQDLATLIPGQTNFRAERPAPAGGWYPVEVRIRCQELVVAQTNVAHVGVGEIFVIAGQSNAANHGEERQRPHSGRVAAFDGEKWQPADDPQPGASGDGGSFLPPLGDLLAERLDVPLGFVSTGVGATSVREWLPRGTRFPRPPTLTANVTSLPSGEWEAKGNLFENFTVRARQLGPHGFRAVLWHQGESDANQSDPDRTLPGPLYRQFLEQLIHDSRAVVGWDFPWFVAQASYHTPEDPGSPEIRAAQQALWEGGIALPGPDTDALVGTFRDSGGRGVHFSGPGLREHGTRWAGKVAHWLEQQLAAGSPAVVTRTNAPGIPSKLVLPGTETFTVAGRPAFVFWPAAAQRTQPQPWILYAPTLPAYPDEAERWMHEQFLAAGIAVAGVDVGEAYGSPQSLKALDALYRELTARRGFAAKPCLFGRSRGGLWVSSWAESNPARVAGLIGIYPVFDFRTYPGLTNAAPAYGLTPDELTARATEFNPIEHVDVLARAGISVALIHGDQDTVVPVRENSAELIRHYWEAHAQKLVQLIVLAGQGHSFFEGFFHSQELVDFAIARARAGASSSSPP